MAMGYFWSILAMMSAPFILIGIVGGVIYHHLRKERRLRAD